MSSIHLFGVVGILVIGWVCMGLFWYPVLWVSKFSKRLVWTMLLAHVGTRPWWWWWYSSIVKFYFQILINMSLTLGLKITKLFPKKIPLTKCFPILKASPKLLFFKYLVLIFVELFFDKKFQCSRDTIVCEISTWQTK
jgi:hypothetical protein